MSLRALLLLVATTFTALTLTVDVPAQTSTAKLTLEQSVNGLSAWQRVPLTADMLKNGDIDFTVVSSNAFYRMKVEVSPTPPVPDNMITVQGGTLPQSSPLAGTTVSTFRIGKYEVTWAEWQEVRAWAITNGYSDLAGVGAGSVANHPVRDVNWYDVVKWCNAKSEKEGFSPFYQVSGVAYRTGEVAPTLNAAANGYRLPTQAEWEWAALGGVDSQGYTYSGSNDVNAVAWFYNNSSAAAVNLEGGRGTWPVGTKAANELGIHDMSGNVWEWCEDIVFDVERRGRGGSWRDMESNCTVAQFDNLAPDNRYTFYGFRLVRNALP